MEIHNIENRTNEIRMAKMCRLCLSSGNQVLIETDRDLRALLGPSYESFLPQDGDLPQLVCEQCFQTIGALWAFAVRGNVSADLMRSYIDDEGPFPTVEIRENRIERMAKRPFSPERIVALGRGRGAGDERKVKEEKVVRNVKTEDAKCDKMKVEADVTKKKVKRTLQETNEVLFGSCDLIPRTPKIDKKIVMKK